MKSIRTILHPTDFSAGSNAAFRYACDLARDYDAALIVLHTLDLGAPIAFEGELLPSAADELRAQAEKQLDALSPPGPAVRLERVLREGPSSATIVDFAGEMKADVIVMGTHGRTGIGRLFLGSVAEEVLRKAPCPVLTVKAVAPAKADNSAGRTASASAWAGV